MKHYICTGECGGVADHPKNCGDESCSMHGKPLVECNCLDGKHDKMKNMKMNPVVHFEMPAKDKKRVSDFYSNVFGWQMTQLGAEMGSYLLAGTTPVDEDNMAKEPGAINGGFFEYKDDDLNRTPHFVIQVDNLDESIEAVKNNGGEIKTDKMDIPGIGTYISFVDSEGNVVGMLQPPKV